VGQRYSADARLTVLGLLRCAPGFQARGDAVVDSAFTFSAPQFQNPADPQEPPGPQPGFMQPAQQTHTSSPTITISSRIRSSSGS